MPLCRLSNPPCRQSDTPSPIAKGT
jgi:hypothetical protein